MAELNGVPISTDEALKTLALTNYGHFTSMRVDQGRVRGLSLHMERLSRDCRTVFDVDLDLGYVRYLLHRMVEGATTFVLRATVFDPALEMGHPGIKAEPKVLVTRRTLATAQLEPLRVQSVRYIRDFPQVKHVGLMGSLRHRRIAQINGYDDAVFIDHDDFITEGPTWNIGFIDGDQVIWPQGDILYGVTRALLVDGYGPSVSARVNLAEINGMEGAFATNTSFGVRPISAIDGHEFIKRHATIQRLRDVYADLDSETL